MDINFYHNIDGMVQPQISSKKIYNNNAVDKF